MAYSERICAMAKAMCSSLELVPMLGLLRSTHLRYTSWGVLAAWLCVLAASAWSPVVRAHVLAPQQVRLCSGAWAPQDTPSPVVQDAQPAALHHVLDCPLCLPVLALPPSACTVAVHAQPHSKSVLCQPQSEWSTAVQLPPVRAPPLPTSQKVESVHAYSV